MATPFRCAYAPKTLDILVVFFTLKNVSSPPWSLTLRTGRTGRKKGGTMVRENRTKDQNKEELVDAKNLANAETKSTSPGPDRSPDNEQDQQRGRLQMINKHLPNGDGVAGAIFVVLGHLVFSCEKMKILVDLGGQSEVSLEDRKPRELPPF